ncbi:ATP-binding protein [Collinsella sp. HCP3S3_B1]|uniref:ATP-binding protein n=1 Tax=unclassified Collinsella TaxID=2637548 RepID=UPI002A8942DA|nr:ATP-binding protein [Collinsella sp.]
MSSNEESYIVRPNPARLLEGLRDTGYVFNTAVADIIDNSIAANATEIWVTAFQGADNKIRVSITDNGTGMDKDALKNAMQYGAAPREDIHCLGKFGLGLKTASTSCCRRLKVISRDDPSGDFECAIWDLDSIAKENDWVLKFEKPTDDDQDELELIEDSAGTVVVWEKCDKLLSARYTNPDSEPFHKAFERSLKELRQHIAMVYERFLNHDDDRAANISIHLNGEAVEAWDPFCKEYDSVGYGEQNIPVSGSIIEGGSSTIKVKAYIVPAKRELLSEKEYDRVMPGRIESLKSFTDMSLSGFYVYRENRLIHWGDWFGIKGVDFHNSLCRFELSFNAELDDIFQVDIKKSRIVLNSLVKSKLVQFADPIKKEGDKRYRGTQRKAAVESSGDMHAEVIPALEKQESDYRGSSMSVNEEGKVEVSNNFGITVTSYDSINAGPVFEVVESLADGILWEPAFIGGKRGVLVNAGHEFYKRYYGNNMDNPLAVKGLDCLFWALAAAETGATSQDAQINLEDSRYDTSRLLRDLARSVMPDVSIEDFEGDGE